MKKSLTWVLMLLLPISAISAPQKAVKLDLDTELSSLSFMGKKAKFKQGSFEVNKGVITGGDLAIDLQPFFSNDVTFKLKKFNDIKSFAPGAPNAEIDGTVMADGKSYPVHTSLFYTPNDHGFDAHTTVKNKLSNVDLVIVAKKKK